MKAVSLRLRTLLMSLAMILTMSGGMMSTMVVHASSTTTSTTATALDASVTTYLQSACVGGTSNSANWTWSSTISQYFSTSATSTKTMAVTFTVTDSNGVATSVILYYASTDITSINNAVTSANNAANATQKVSDITNNLGVTADTTTASETLKGVAPVVSWILGLLTIVLIFALAITTGMDYLYINVPPVRDWMTDNKDGGGVMGKKTASGDTKFRLISDEAQFAVQQCTVENGKNPNVTYTVKRVWAYIIVSIAIYIFASGNIAVFTNIGLKLAKGVINIISGI